MRSIPPVLVLGTALLASLFTGCGSSNNAVAGCTPPTGIDLSKLNLVQDGKLTVATDATYAPQEYVDSKTHAYTGMEVDLANEFAKRLCLTSSVQNVQFNTILTGITFSSPGNQYYDMSLSAWTITPERQKQVDMIPYFTAGESMLLPAGNPKNIKTTKDLCGLAVAVEAGTTEEGEIKGVVGESSPGLNEKGGACHNNLVKLQSLDTETQALSELLNGSVDAAYQDSPVSGYYNKLNGNKFAEVSTVSPSPEGVVVRKDNAPFEAAIKQVLQSMQSDGTYDTILNNWGLKSGSCTLSSPCAQQAP
jgi:polar amino acid transport system substrate-binding protein